MLKRITLLVAIGLLATVVFAAAPEYNNWANANIDTMTIDSQWTSAWEFIDSIIIIKTDTCYTLYTIQGMALLGYNDVLYIGFIDGGHDLTVAPADTLIIKSPAVYSVDPTYIPFRFTYLDSLESQDDLNDTIYFMAAVSGSAPAGPVFIQDLLLTATVLDFNAAGVVGE